MGSTESEFVPPPSKVLNTKEEAPETPKVYNESSSILVNSKDINAVIDFVDNKLNEYSKWNWI